MTQVHFFTRLVRLGTAVTALCLLGTTGFNITEIAGYIARAEELSTIPQPEPQHLTIASTHLKSYLGGFEALETRQPTLIIGTAPACALCDAARGQYAEVVRQLSLDGAAPSVVELVATQGEQPVSESPLRSVRLRIDDPDAFAAATGVRGVPFAFAVDRGGGIALHVMGLPGDQDVAALVASLRRTSNGEATRMLVREYIPMAVLTAPVASGGPK